MSMDDTFYAELVALCERKEYTDVQTLLGGKISQAAILGVLTLAITNDKEDVVDLVLVNTKCNLQAPVQKDGKTLLHVAVSKKNVHIIRSLLKAGALISAVDKKGVRVADTATWSGVVYPAIALPLQDAIFTLQRHNAALRLDADIMDDLAQQTRRATSDLEALIHDAREQLEAAISYRRSLEQKIEDSIYDIQQADDSIRTQLPKLALVKEEIAKTRATKACMFGRLEEIKAAIGEISQNCDDLRQECAAQSDQIDVYARQTAVKCEAMSSTRSQLKEEQVQALWMRSLKAQCERVDVVRKLAKNGLQELLLAMVAQFPDNAEIFSNFCLFCTQLCRMKLSFPNDTALQTYLYPWPTQTLVDSVVMGTLRFAQSPEYESLHIQAVDLLEGFSQSMTLLDTNHTDAKRALNDACIRLGVSPLLSK
ncbi:hypothetical protein Poli38472_006540 [Pythium oligandrum]|uniref:Uncharacterized protein n=1 Tax=Pythium oligandrum TaxID=41045 RepID=A0A8K1C4Z5_PYTOL|nr:hypothetical protein Poli38472_006540 [Pythium oligandrum]|eukprot:TMW56530.1 hypothetical protein Poli38472_006540 [Pythium oligandrum]